jgi:hypothetical protein
MNPLSVPETIAVLRQRDPDGLVCVECGLLLATRRESYAGSNLTEAERLDYTCLECRQDSAAAERLIEARRANLAQARAAKEVRSTNNTAFAEADERLPASPRQTGQFGQVIADGRVAMHRGGRPRVHRSRRAAEVTRRATNREASRRYRHRRRSAVADEPPSRASSRRPQGMAQVVRQGVRVGKERSEQASRSKADAFAS